MDDWGKEEDAPYMHVVEVHHEYFSHGQVRQAYKNKDGEWVGINADGTEGDLRFEPTHWKPLPQTPRKNHG